MTLHVGVVGSGFMARQHVRSWRSLGATVVVFSQDAAEAATLGSRYPVRVVGTLDDLVAVCTLVDICTPTDQHVSVIRAVIFAGVDVICEKPLARTATDAAAIVAECAAAGVRLFPAHVARYVPEYAAARTEIERGSIGTPAITHFSRSGPRPSWAGWFADAARSGGILMDLMIHDYDIAAWFCGPVERVFARTRSIDAGKEVGTAVLTHRSGAVSHIRGVWGGERSPLATEFRVYGDGGYFVTGSGSRQTVLRRDEDGAERRIPARTSGVVDPFRRELSDFAEAIAEGRSASVCPADGVAAVRVAEAAIRSAATGTAITLEEARA